MSNNVGYFYYRVREGQHYGAILVTNSVGIPIEFKYTDPIACNMLHKVLYGASLTRYLRQNLIRERLVAELESAVEFFIAPYEERDFLAPVAGRSMIAVEEMSRVSGEEGEEFTRVRERDAIVAFEEGPRLRVAFSTPDDAEQRNVVAWLRELSRTMDLLEPLERVRHALDLLCEETAGAAV